jgi:hypothetical protein
MCSGLVEVEKCTKDIPAGSDWRLRCLPRPTTDRYVHNLTVKNFDSNFSDGKHFVFPISTALHLLLPPDAANQSHLVTHVTLHAAAAHCVMWASIEMYEIVLQECGARQLKHCQHGKHVVDAPVDISVKSVTFKGAFLRFDLSVIVVIFHCVYVLSLYLPPAPPLSLHHITQRCCSAARTRVGNYTLLHLSSQGCQI